MTLSDVVDAVVDGMYTSISTLMGYVAGTGGAIAMPSKEVLLVAALTGLGGFLNQLRALRKQPRA